MEDRSRRRQFRKIVVTGGPCAGKTTGLTWIQNSFEKMGYTVLFLQEPATEMMTAGVTPARCSSPMAYQEFQMELQYEKEKLFERAALDIAYAHPEADAEEKGTEEEGKTPLVPRKVLVVCDRGFFDNLAYMSGEEFRQVLEKLNVTEEKLLAGYDGVFHLETTAKNATVFYGNANNAVRGETPEEAARLDDRLIEAWSRHPHFRVIENFSGFEDKMRLLVAEIAACLGEPVPPEIRRRYLIDYPDTEMLEGLEDCHRIEIEQAYLRSAENVEIRIRSQKSGADSMFYETRYLLSEGKRRLDSELRLSAHNYHKMLAHADPDRGRLKKTRYRLNWKGTNFDIDLYEMWGDQALLEVSLRDEDQQIDFPPFLSIRKEVTGDERYEISHLAKHYAALNASPSSDPAQGAAENH